MADSKRKFEIKNAEIKGVYAKDKEKAEKVPSIKFEVDFGSDSEKDLKDIIATGKLKVEGTEKDCTFKLKGGKVKKSFYWDKIENVEIGEIKDGTTVLSNAVVKEKGTAKATQWRWVSTGLTIGVVLLILGGGLWWFFASRKKADDKEEGDL